jgi:hypothetical protein
LLSKPLPRGEVEFGQDGSRIGLWVRVSLSRPVIRRFDTMPLEIINIVIGLAFVAVCILVSSVLVRQL